MPGLGWTAVVEAADLAPGCGGVFVVRGAPVAIFRRGERFHALGARCPHAGSLLSEFPTDDGTALCPSHGWEFRLDDGACTNERAQRVPVYRVAVEDGLVWVRVRPLAAILADALRGGARKGNLAGARRLR